jgi:hypothetical protein
MEMSQGNSLQSYLKQIKIPFFSKNGEQEGKTAPVWGLAPLGEEGYKDVDGECSGSIMHSCMKMEK